MKLKRVFTEEQKAVLCKYSLIQYLARDKDGSLWGYSRKPERSHDNWIGSGSGTYIYLGSLRHEFPQITWEDEAPTSREEILGEPKLIEEMAKDLEEARYYAMATVGSLNNGFGGWYGAYMYKKGYRKQSDTAREILRMIKDKGLFRYGGYLLHDSDFDTVAKLYGVNPEEV